MAQSDRSPAFQFYPKDFLSDPNVMLMTNAQVGAYWKLVSICWIQDGLPNDPAMLARLVGESEEWWSEFGELIKGCFKTGPGRRAGKSILVHPRLIAEKKRQRNRRNQAREAGKKSAEKRKANQEVTNDRSNSVGTESNPPSSSSSSSPSSSVPNGTERESAHTQTRSCFVPPDWIPETILPGQARISPGVDLDHELAKFRLHEFAQPKSNWQAAWLKWLSNAKPGPQATTGDPKIDRTLQAAREFLNGG